MSYPYTTYIIYFSYVACILIDITSYSSRILSQFLIISYMGRGPSLAVHTSETCDALEWWPEANSRSPEALFFVVVTPRTNLLAILMLLALLLLISKHFLRFLLLRNAKKFFAAL